ncbi:hypothetical protein SAMN05443247_06219 [Bradyrhizobium erythrophlei]|jgi:hypothetical protein|nr:hypothetical protein SAMN05443247_06219 [Bradyrhizobium erythrophlei]
MTLYGQFYTERTQAASSAVRNGPHPKTRVAGAVRTLNLTVADVLYTYAVTGSAFATLMMLAAPHLEVFLRCIFQGKG